MRANLDATGGLIYTSPVLLKPVEAGLSREDAYAFVQAAAMATWRRGPPFRDTLRTRPRRRRAPGRGAAGRRLPPGALPR